MSSLKERILDDMKAAMRAREKERLGAIRLITAAIKQYEVDNRADIDETTLLALLDKMAKQRRESIKQFTEAGRMDLVGPEEFELELIQSYLPQALSDDEIVTLVKEAISESQAASIKDMGKVMALLKPKMQGRADMSEVSRQVKENLSAL